MSLKPALSLEFMTALGALSKREQKAVRATVAKLMSDADLKGLRDHKLSHPSGRLYSISANMDLRIIVFRGGQELTLLYVDHHDVAYAWAARRKFVDSGEALRILVSSVSHGEDSAETALAQALKRPPLPSIAEQSAAVIELYRQQIDALETDDAALDFLAGLPVSDAVRDDLLDFVVRRTAEYKLLPRETVQAVNDEELQRALELPLDLWRVFLHPRQRELAYASPETSVLVTGGPGTGKTVCLVHRVRHIISELPAGEVVVLTTYKEHLEDYLNEMLTKLDVDRSKVVVTDVQAFKVVEPEVERSVRLHGFFEVSDKGVHYYDHGTRLRVRHVLFDEYQDFRQSQLGSIRRLIQVAPYTIAFDYTQAIYRPPREEIRGLVAGEDSVALTRLDYCYRLNSGIVAQLKKLVRAIRVLSAHALNTKARVDLLDFEEELVGSMTAAVSGPPPRVFAYDNRGELEQFIAGAIAEAQLKFAPGEIVLTAFVPEVYKHLNESERFGAEMVHQGVRAHYRFIATLKGKEFKCGIVILDDSICEMLNLNAGVLGGTVPTGWKADAGGYRLALNLLYVGLSRFRDVLIVCYPREYGIVIGPLLDARRG